MALKLLLDENLRHGSLLNALETQAAAGPHSLDVVRVGDPNCPPLGCDDAEVIRWAAQHDRIVCSLDARTLGRALADLLAAGASSPGVILLRSGLSASEVLELLQLIAHASDREEWQDAIHWIP